MKMKISLILFLYSALVYGQSTISNLPLKNQIEPSDNFVIEDSDATKRVKASTLQNFLPSQVQEITSVDGSITVTHDPATGVYDLSLANLGYPVEWVYLNNAQVINGNLSKTTNSNGFDSSANNDSQQIQGNFEVSFSIDVWPTTFHIGIGNSFYIGYPGVIDNEFSLKIDEDAAGNIGHYERENIVEDHQTNLASGSDILLRYEDGTFSYFVDGIFIDSHFLDLSAEFPLTLEANLYSPNSAILGATLKDL